MDNENNFNLFSYNDIKIYIHKGTNVQENIEILLKSNIPILGPNFAVKGVSLK